MKKIFWSLFNFKKIIRTVLSYLSILSIGKILSLNSDVTDAFSGMYFGYNLIAVALFVLNIYILHRFCELKNRRLKIFSCIAGFLLAFCIVYGAYAHFMNDIFISIQESIMQLFLIVGIMIFTVPLSAEIFQLAEKFCFWNENTMYLEPPLFMRNSKVYFGVVWGIIFLTYVPLFLSQWPGNFIFDAKYQISNVINNHYTTHHPLLHTWLMGTAYNFGVKQGNASFGFQFYTLLQMLVLSSSFAYCLLYLYKRKVQRSLRIGILLWFAFFPMHPLFAITATKDVIFAAFFLYTMIFFVRLLYDKERFRWYSYLGLISVSALSILFRNNAIYAIILFAVGCTLLTKGWKNKVQKVMLFLLIYMLASAGNKILVNALDASEVDAYRESLSVPLQGMARVVAYRGEELEQSYYEEICQYIRPMDIPYYNPYISDPIKNYANENLLKTNTINFMKLWLKVGLKYPDEYFESIVTNTLGYWYPLNEFAYVNMDIALYHTLIGTEHEIVKENYFPWANGIYSDLFYLGNYKYTPVLGFLFRNALYIWMIVYSVLWCLYKKKKSGGMILILPVAYLITCMLGPVSALRYIYNLIVSIPVYVYIIIKR